MSRHLLVASLICSTVLTACTVTLPPPVNAPSAPAAAATATRAPTDAPTQPPADTPPPAVTQRPKATVKSANLNVRSGPGSNYPVIGSARQGETMTVTGQTGDCAWLAVNTGSGKAGWVSGDANLVTQSAACSSIPEAPGPAGAARAPQGYCCRRRTASPGWRRR